MSTISSLYYCFSKIYQKVVYNSYWMQRYKNIINNKRNAKKKSIKIYDLSIIGSF